MRNSVTISLSVLAALSMTAAGAQDPTPLPAGRYVYLGADPNSSAPKAFSITSTGAVLWQGDSPVTPKPSGTTADLIWQGDSLAGPKGADGRPAARTDVHRTKPDQPAMAPRTDPGATQVTLAGKGSTEHIESLDWPIIKFHPKPVLGSKDGFAQLTTTEEVTGGGTMGKVKYKLILLRAEPMELTVELLDENGFRLENQFMVHANDFQAIPGTELLAARGELMFGLSEYPKVRDFSLTPRRERTMFMPPPQQLKFGPLQP